MNKVNVGVVGAGYWGQKIIKELHKHPMVSDIIVVTRTSSSITFDTLLRRHDIGHVFIVTPVDTHFDLCRRAIIAGKNVMCEKNFTQTPSEAEMLATLAGRNNVNILVDYIYSFNPILRQVNIYPTSHFRVDFLQYGAFRSEHVMSMLGCHALSIAANFCNLEEVCSKVAYSTDDDVFVDYGLFAIHVSRTCAPGVKIRQLVTETGIVNLQYENGINLMISKFLNGETNINTALAISRLIKNTFL